MPSPASFVGLATLPVAAYASRFACVLNFDDVPPGVGLAAGDQFRGAKRDCVPCPQRAQCLRTPEKTQTRQVMFFHGRVAAKPKPETHTASMKRRLDTPQGRAQYGQRLGTVEPVFANVCYNKGLDRFTVRGRIKVDAQWKLFCLAHNIEKLAHHGYAA